MPILTGYAPSSFDILSGATDLTTVGGRFRVSPTFDASVNAITIDIADDDSRLSGDDVQNEVGDDANQTATIRDASGNVLNSGQIYIEGFRLLTAPDGTTIQLFQLEIGGVSVGWLAQPELQPGVTYEVGASGNITDANAPSYSGFTDTVDYDPDLANTILGGNFADSIRGGAGDDHITGGAGNDTLRGEAGRDTLIGGTGNDSMTGGSESDLFVIGDAHGSDTIVGGETGFDSDFMQFDGSGSGQGVDIVFTATEQGFYDFLGTTGFGLFSGIEGIYGTSFADLVDASRSGGDLSFEMSGGNDIVKGGFGKDFILGGDGNDTLSGAQGDDILRQNGSTGTGRMYGGEGNDGFIAGDGGDFISGDGLWIDPADYASVAGGTATNLTLTNSADGAVGLWRIATDGSLQFVRDLAPGETHVQATTDTENWMLRDANNYYLRVIEGAPNQSVNYGATGLADTITGGAGADTIYTGFGAATVTGGGGDDYIDDVWASTTGGHRDIDAGSGNDTVMAGDGTSTIRGGLGHDEIYGEGGADTIDGDDGNDLIDGGDGDDILRGGAGSDTIAGGAGSDLIEGGDGDDFLTTGTGNDTLLGGAGNDTLMNSSGDDSLVGGAGDDSIVATGGNDTLEGGDGADTMDGGADNDRLEGGTGDDVMTGGAGDDTFVYNVGDGADTITDFNAGNTGAIGDGDNTNNDFIDLSAFYDSIFELRRDFADDGLLNQSTSDDFSDNAQFGAGDSLFFQGATQSSFQSDNTNVVCFVSGTLILTPQGEVPVERLRPGDLVVTRDNGPQPLVWSTMRRLGPADLARAPHLRPVEIAAGTFGNARPLVVSPQHGVLLTLDGTETLARTIHLARTKGGGVRQRAGCRHVSYWHLLFDRHQIVFSNGLASESFFPGPQALAGLRPTARRELLTLFPEFGGIATPSQAAATYGAPARAYSRTVLMPDHIREFAPAL